VIGLPIMVLRYLRPYRRLRDAPILILDEPTASLDSETEALIMQGLKNVRLRTGWFSERSACYLGAGRPVITQDTGFGSVLPTGEGLFAFESFDDIMAAFEAIRSDYARQARAARAIAEEYFRAETVMARLLRDLGLA
jgi:ABC-type protease/lipase transport system fused ATPase/permease subunit